MQAFAQDRMSASVSSKLVGRTDYFTYRITVNEPRNLKTFTPPDFRNFHVLSTPLQQWDRAEDRVFFDFVLQPKAAGSFTLEPARCFMDGKVVSSNEVTVTVSKREDPGAPDQQPPRPSLRDVIFKTGDSVETKLNGNMLLKLDVSKSTCYVGEPVIAQYYLYARLKNEIADRQNLSFSGFSVIDILSQDLLNITTSSYKGKTYNVSVLRKAQLYPLQPGTITLEPSELQTSVAFIKAEYAAGVKDTLQLYENFVSGSLPAAAEIHKTITLRNDPVSIHVKPLPHAGQPPSFRGAVGDFRLAARLQKDDFSMDEAGKLSVEISGSGNMQLLTPPEVSWGKGIESFEPKLSEQLTNLTVPVSGKRIFEYSFTAADTGNYFVPPIEFSYFDPETETYVTAATAPFPFHVSKALKGKKNWAGLTKKKVTSFATEVFSHRWWIVVFIAVVMFTAIVLWLLRDKKRSRRLQSVSITKDDKTEALIKSEIEEERTFAETRKCLNEEDCSHFYIILGKEFKNSLARIFSVEANALNSQTVMPLLDEQGIPNSLALEIQQLLETLEWQVYTPFERTGKMETLYEQACELSERARMTKFSSR